MRTKSLTVVAILVATFLLATNPVVADAAKLITGKQIKDNSVTGKDVKESSLATVPSAATLAPLKTGETQSGVFGMGGPDRPTTTDTVDGYLGTAINYPRPLAEPIADDHIIDTFTSPDPENCPGPGEAAPGFLCLYFNYHDGLNYLYGYSDDYPMNGLAQSVGVTLYAQTSNGNSTYADGVWTVTAP